MSQEGNKWTMAGDNKKDHSHENRSCEGRSCPPAPKKSQPSPRYNDSFGGQNLNTNFDQEAQRSS
ncbi:hypothetical protein RchiOBHm_Chr4g0409131 [Rosa chinensis]|uniref:Uncharacterized protein n=1 Tax=Rosa chinensis TaxID=74649 RepID=A0A2P6QV47_ROSCH|nr:hypothetical protein RchiOBHm_Chr4g0409131 [Rosa chinensis]